MIPRAFAAVFAGLALAFTALPASAALPAGPTNFRATESTQTGVSLAWEAVRDAYSYRIQYDRYQDFRSNTFTYRQATSVTVNGLTPGAAYNFRVQAVSSAAGYPAITEWSPKIVFATKPLMRISIGTFNIHNPNTTCTKITDWCRRRAWVAYAIQTEGLQALGIQEAYQEEERRDLLDAVNDRYADIDPWKMAPSEGNDAGYDNRILYDTRVFEPLAAGARRYVNQSAGEDALRWMAWAKLRHRASGVVIMFVTTHLQPSGSDADLIDERQWSELIAETNKRTAEAPVARYVVAAGDFNTSRYESPARYRIDDMKRAGYGDILGQQYRTDATSGARAQVRRDAWLNSGNGFSSKVICSGEGRNANCRNNRTLNGFSVDWIFASNSLKVPAYRVWTRWSSYPTTFALPLASDHHLVRAIISQ